MVSFALQKHFSLMLLSLFNFAFVAFAFGIKLKKSLPRPIQGVFSYVFFLEFYDDPFL